MSDDFTKPDTDDSAAELGADALDELSSLLADPALWEDSDPADEAAILAAIGDLADSSGGPNQASMPPSSNPADGDSTASNVVSISSARRWLGPFVAGVAAAIALVAGVSILTDDPGREGVELALSGTELAPSASGVVEIVDTPNGTVLLLDVSGLPPAPEGSYYEAWVRQDAEVGVSAGTFHLRGGGGEIELWAGVTTDDYPLFTVTIQDEADPVSSGQVVLRGLLER